jgi:ubiquinone/menaquinone biosynthesis C-methylase UbiE
VQDEGKQVADMSSNADRNWAWREFWKSDRVASCVPQNEATQYQIAQHWRNFFAGLPAHSRILDVATGNGFVLRQAASIGVHFSLTGVDLASIDPHRYVAPTGDGGCDMRFLANVDAESLPFPDNCFDAVVSQYGLEYADLGNGLTEVERVLSANGHLQWLAHSDASEVVLQNRDQNIQVDFLLQHNGVIAAMERLVSRIRRNKNTQSPMGKLDQAMRAAEQFCRDHAATGIVVEICSGLAEVANRWQVYDARDLEKMIERSKMELIAHRQRIKDLQNAVIDANRRQWLESRLRSSAWESATFSTLRAGATDGPIGLLIAAQRSDRP